MLNMEKTIKLSNENMRYPGCYEMKYHFDKLMRADEYDVLIIDLQEVRNAPCSYWLGITLSYNKRFKEQRNGVFQIINCPYYIKKMFDTYQLEKVISKIT